MPRPLDTSKKVILTIIDKDRKCKGLSFRVKGEVTAEKIIEKVNQFLEKEL